MKFKICVLEIVVKRRTVFVVLHRYRSLHCTLTWTSFSVPGNMTLLIRYNELVFIYMYIYIYIYTKIPTAGFMLLFSILKHLYIRSMHYINEKLIWYHIFLKNYHNHISIWQECFLPISLDGAVFQFATADMRCLGFDRTIGWNL